VWKKIIIIVMSLRIFYQLFLAAAYIFSAAHCSKIKFKSITTRHLRKDDFGLIFDVTIFNDAQSPKETLNFEISSEKCCLLINGKYDCEVN
jgi:hypothetical protein